MATATELHKAGGYVRDWSTNTWIKYFRVDTGDEDDAIALAPANGTVVDGLYVVKAEARRLPSPNWCELAVHYASSPPSTDASGGGSVKSRSEGAQYERFSIATENEHVARARSQTTYGTAKIDPGDVVGVNEKGDVEGVDIHVPTFSYEITHVWDATDVDSAFINTLFGLTGRVNSSTWKYFDAGEALFVGAESNQFSTTRIELCYHFLCRPNETIAVTTVDGVENVVKGGWQHLWYQYGKDVTGAVGAKKLRWQIHAAFAATHYLTGSFSSLGL